jgi:hypothetical protein
MPKRRTVALIFATLLSVLAGQQHAAGQPAATPTAIRVAWADPQHTKVRISWTDGGEPNVVRSEASDGAVRDAIDEHVAAGAPNELVLEPDRFPVNSSSMRIAVYEAIDGRPAGTPGRSADFDTVRPHPALSGIDRMVSGGAVALSWQLPAGSDRTPRDPLDVTGGTRLSVDATRSGSCRWDSYPLSPSARSYQLPARPRPYLARVSVGNEWGELAAPSELSVGDFRLAASIPRSLVYGRGYLVTGGVWAVRADTCEFGTPRLRVEYGNDLVILQRRVNANSPWTTAGGGYADSRGRFRIAAVAAGTVQLRAWVPSQLVGATDSVAYGTATAPVTAVTRHRIDSARFLDHTAVYGQRVTASLDVAPDVNSWTMLQRWTGRAWVNVVRVPVRAGRASYPFTATRRGVTGWRFYLPAASYNGRAVAATVTGSFILGVR